MGLGLVTDLYQLTMAAGYFEAGKAQDRATFELSIRRLPHNRNFILAAGLAQAARLLKPSGMLVVTVPALPSLWGAQDIVSHHRRRYTKRSLRALFTRAGLPAPELTYFNTLLFPPLAAVRWLARARKLSAQPPSDFEKNRPGLANEILARVFALERHLLRHLTLPIGASLLASLQASRVRSRSTPDGRGLR